MNSLGERVTECGACFDTDKCFVDELENGFKSYMCFHCGYTTNTEYYEGSDQHNKQLEKTGEFIRDMRIFDEDRGLYWYPSVLNMGNLGIIYPEANLESEFSLEAGVSFVWKYAKPVKVPKEDRDKYDGHEFRLDIENAVTYEKYEFLQACKDMGITKDL
tara:strand:+ start:3680 stop:4159 length:480 start_codon:yes stop_codon:yes gene_type:complete